MEIKRSQDCGNSPKNQLVENLTIALLTGKLQTQSEIVTDDSEWTIVGGKSLSGRKAMLVEMEAVRGRSILKLSIDHAITHGKAGAVNGEGQYESSKEGFCFVFEFANIKGTTLRQITSYQLPMVMVNI